METGHLGGHARYSFSVARLVQQSVNAPFSVFTVKNVPIPKPMVIVKMQNRWRIDVCSVVDARGSSVHAEPAK